MARRPEVGASEAGATAAHRSATDASADSSAAPSSTSVSSPSTATGPAAWSSDSPSALQAAQPELAEAGQLDQELLAQRIAAEAGLEVGPIRRSQPLVGRTKAIAGSRCVPLGRSQAISRDRVGRAQLGQGRRCRRFALRGDCQLGSERLALGDQRSRPLAECRGFALRAGDPLLVHRRRRLGTRASSLRLAVRRVERRLLCRQPIADGAQLRDASLPRGERRAVVCSRVGSRARFAFRGRGLVRGDRSAQPDDLCGQTLGLRLLPARLAD